MNLSQARSILEQRLALADDRPDPARMREAVEVVLAHLPKEASFEGVLDRLGIPAPLHDDILG